MAAGDFRQIGLGFRGSGGLETALKLKNPAVGRPFRPKGDPFSDAETGWLGRKELNLDMAISKSDALAVREELQKPLA